MPIGPDLKNHSTELYLAQNRNENFIKYNTCNE